MSKADSSEKYGRWRDLDPRRHCTVCSKAGLRWDNATGLCAGCFRQLPQVAKASRSTEAKAVLQGFARTMVDRPGLACAALDAAAVSARLGGRFRIAPVAAGTDDSLELTGLRPPAVPGRSGEPQVELDSEGLDPPAPPPRRARQLSGRDLGLPVGVRPDQVALAHVLGRYRDLTSLPPMLTRIPVSKGIISCLLERAKSRFDRAKFTARDEAKSFGMSAAPATALRSRRK